MAFEGRLVFIIFDVQFNPVNPSILSFNPSTPSISSLPGQENQLFSKRKEETKNEETFHPFVSSSSNSLPNGHYHTNLHHFPSNLFTRFFLINQNFFLVSKDDITFDQEIFGSSGQIKRKRDPQALCFGSLWVGSTLFKWGSLYL